MNGLRTRALIFVNVRDCYLQQHQRDAKGDGGGKHRLPSDQGKAKCFKISTLGSYWVDHKHTNVNHSTPITMVGVGRDGTGGGVVVSHHSETVRGRRGA
jgi:hypothetical protein